MKTQIALAAAKKNPYANVRKDKRVLSIIKEDLPHLVKLFPGTANV